MHTPDLQKELLPGEAAKLLGISMQKLARLRRQGKVCGTKVGETNLFTYTLEDLRRADLKKEKRGPKPKR